MYSERGFVPDNKDSLKAERAALIAKQKELEEYGDAGEIARVEEAIENADLKILGIPEAKWRA